MHPNGTIVLKVACLLALPACLRGHGPCRGAETTSPPRFSARVEVARTRERSLDVEAEIRGAKELFLVVSGAHWGWADWAEPRLVGPAGELRLTDLTWKFASVGYGQARVNANVRGDPLRINGAPVSYGIGVHDPSLIIYDLPPGYTHFRARGGLDDGGSGPVTFLVYADSPFFDPANPQLWQRDCRRELAEDPPAFVEFTGGDRMPGAVIAAGVADRGTLPGAVPILIVQPSANVNRPDDSQRDAVRVITRFVQRVVWVPPAEDAAACGPGWARLRNGTRLRVRTARFDGQVVKLLTPEGLQEAALAEMAEIHLPQRDLWDAYCEELAVLSPELTSPLVRCETDRGLVVTASLDRLRYLPPLHHDAEPLRWHLGLQPAWSLDMLWLGENSLVARSQFPPQRVPLSARFSTPSADGEEPHETCWRPRTNHSVRGFPLASGGRTFSWGYGVHATSRLTFPLPPLAEAFRTRVGLDHSVGDRGCARARILLDGPESRRLWESPLLIGSAQIHDSGRLPIPDDSGEQRYLVLQADAAHDERPAGADPFAIRDMIDWVDPQVELHGGNLRKATAQRITRWIPDWQGWQLGGGENHPPRLINRWETSETGPSGFRLAISSGDRPLTLTRHLNLNGRNRRLRIVVARPPGRDVGSAELEVRIDGRSRHRGEVPLRRDESGLPDAMLVPIPVAKSTDVTIEIIQRPSDAQTLVEWHALEILDDLSSSAALLLR